jgi:hypothetical protein
MKRYALFTREVVGFPGGMRITFSTVPSTIEDKIWWLEAELLEDAMDRIRVVLNALKTELEIELGTETFPRFYLAEINSDATIMNASKAYSYILGDFHPVKIFDKY